MPGMTDEHNEHIEGLGGERDRLTGKATDVPLRQNEVAKFENLVFQGTHYASFGNLQEKSKAFPKTSPLAPITELGDIMRAASMNIPATSRTRQATRDRVASDCIAGVTLSLISMTIKICRCGT